MVLTHRPAEDWWRSFTSTIQQALKSGKDVGGIGSRVITERVFAGNIDDKEHVLSNYEASIASVRAEVPSDRLIDLPLGSGWEPLCSGLGLSEPEIAYPMGNTKDGFRSVA